MRASVGGHGLRCARANLGEGTRTCCAPSWAPGGPCKAQELHLSSPPTCRPPHYATPHLEAERASSPARVAGAGACGGRGRAGASEGREQGGGGPRPPVVARRDGDCKLEEAGPAPGVSKACPVARSARQFDTIWNARQFSEAPPATQAAPRLCNCSSTASPPPTPSPYKSSANRRRRRASRLGRCVTVMIPTESLCLFGSERHAGQHHQKLSESSVDCAVKCTGSQLEPH